MTTNEPDLTYIHICRIRSRSRIGQNEDSSTGTGIEEKGATSV